MNSSQKITPCLWFDSNAAEAAHFYAGLFDGSRINNVVYYTDEGKEITGKDAGTVLTVDFDLAGYKFTGLNGGPLFKFTPAISFFVTCETVAEIDALWTQLLQGGFAMMPLDRYDWSERYGWVQDKFGLTWQLSLGKLRDVGGQKIVPALLFVGQQHGKAEAAMNLYSEIFRGSKIDGLLRYAAGEGEPIAAGTIKHAQFGLGSGDEKFMVMDSAAAHQFTFNEAISLQIDCATQDEVDYFWGKLIADGGEEQPCGWLKDKFGVSWQVSPTVLHEMLQDHDVEKVKRVTRAFLQMKKFDIAALQRAFSGA
jgi:predicted 3-demethylubiquinone-9 3-methyltransferase (glyoxalase superfamily)